MPTGTRRRRGNVLRGMARNLTRGIGSLFQRRNTRKKSTRVAPADPIPKGYEIEKVPERQMNSGAIERQKQEIENTYRQEQEAVRRVIAAERARQMGRLQAKLKARSSGTPKSPTVVLKPQLNIKTPKSPRRRSTITNLVKRIESLSPEQQTRFLGRISGSPIASAFAQSPQVFPPGVVPTEENILKAYERAREEEERAKYIEQLRKEALLREYRSYDTNLKEYRERKRYLKGKRNRSNLAYRGALPVLMEQLEKELALKEKAADRFFSNTDPRVQEYVKKMEEYKRLSQLHRYDISRINKKLRNLERIAKPRLNERNKLERQLIQTYGYRLLDLDPDLF